mmetsp:Transcript_139013/g.432487  ORF Transcript_139013/g.432487 Transcript_139013/m.432487 type:complete len:308 (-) Transcript_139013:627-1550(-)
MHRRPGGRPTGDERSAARSLVGGLVLQVLLAVLGPLGAVLGLGGVPRDLAGHLHVQEIVVDLRDGFPDLLRGEGAHQGQRHEHHLQGQEPHAPPVRLHVLPRPAEAHVPEATDVPAPEDVGADVVQERLLPDHDNQDRLDGEELPRRVPVVQQVVRRLVGDEEAPQADETRHNEDILHRLRGLVERVHVDGREDGQAQDAHERRHEDVLPHHDEDGREVLHREVVLRQAGQKKTAGRRAEVLPPARPRQRVGHHLDSALLLRLTVGRLEEVALVPEQREEQHAEGGQRDRLVELRHERGEQKGGGAV